MGVFTPIGMATKNPLLANLSPQKLVKGVPTPNAACPSAYLSTSKSAKCYRSLIPIGLGGTNGKIKK
jgi:hypothetical protein